MEKTGERYAMFIGFDYAICLMDVEWKHYHQIINGFSWDVETCQL